MVKDVEGSCRILQENISYIMNSQREETSIEQKKLDPRLQ